MNNRNLRCQFFLVVTVMIIPLWSLIVGIISLFPLRLFTCLQNSDQLLLHFVVLTPEMSPVLFLWPPAVLYTAVSVPLDISNFLLMYNPITFTVSHFTYLLQHSESSFFSHNRMWYNTITTLEDYLLKTFPHFLHATSITGP